MTLDEIVTAARSRAGDTDPLAYRYPFNTYVQLVKDLTRAYGVRRVLQMDQLVVDATAGSEAMTPDASDIQGLLLATATAWRLLQQTYRRRIDEGSLGVSWSSGLESETSISAQAAYQAILDALQLEVEELVLHANRNTFASRVQ